VGLRHGLIIGAGVRRSDDLMFWMEELIRTTHEISPKTQILFNTTYAPLIELESILTLHLSPQDNPATAERIKLA